MEITLTKANNGWIVKIQPDGQPAMINLEKSFDDIIAGMIQMNEASKAAVKGAIPGANNSVPLFPGREVEPSKE